MAELDATTRLEIYKLVLNRYKGLITEKETRPISEIRQRVSPYHPLVKKLRDSFIADMAPYDPRRNFPAASERAMDYIRQIKTCEFAFTFWVEFEEMDKLHIGTPMDKAIFLCAILRALEAQDSRVLVTKKGRSLVKFVHGSSVYLFVPESGSLLAGEDLQKLFSDDPVAYSFSDLSYENYEES
ncbi:MAG TPA: hypothetical protein VLD37_00840 [Candidatus Bilamarchaeum sp.]|nr:hypothetical protein [Candidatus Bilamarchaeum sp.]